jgi:hypothetical protein
LDILGRVWIVFGIVWGELELRVEEDRKKKGGFGKGVVLK